MRPNNVEINIAVLHPPASISALKLRSWLHYEAGELQQIYGPNSFNIIRLYLTKRMKFSFPQKKLDALLQSVTDKQKTIFRIDLVTVDVQLDQAGLGEAIEKAQADREKMALGTDTFIQMRTGHAGVVR